MFGGIFLAKVPKPGGMLEGKYRAFFCLTAFSSHLLTPFKGGEFIIEKYFDLGDGKYLKGDVE